MRQIVADYKIIADIATPSQVPRGLSCSPLDLILHILDDNSRSASVLDIGFGAGRLGTLLKANDATRHWSIDGVDGWEVNCQNRELFAKEIYRNVWCGLAQDLSREQLQSYDIICLLDVIEHLSAETAKWLFRSLLSGLGENSHLFVSTPLWFAPQAQIQSGDLEEHLIGVPASSMLALLPTRYAFNPPLVGGFVYRKRSLDYIELFQPCADKGFSFDKGLKVLQALNIPYQPGVLYCSGV